MISCENVNNSNSVLEYRLFQIEKDLKEMSKLYVDSWRVSYWFVPKEHLDKMTYEESEEKWTEFVKGKDSFIYLCVGNGVVCGMAAVRRDPEENTFELYTLHILHSHKGKGIGKKLMKTVAQHFIDNQSTLNCKCLYLWAVPINTPAVSLYTKLGATILKYQTEYFAGIGLDEIGLHWTDLNLILNN
ncbi:hypothetical protein DICPUDRAFT_83985 [Dictyostelium purpureum]|uniref:N-acetyltransferase domain-containing protein n=1 Tax=Dictyostelium purpureum TaxID=5786 RepID=F1A188_DICPU|nr:uncharacterized protein DICPUDRAFT_83985 [Dictyostelium purpureum]EGC30049.1 hypothetical protein DICPUDRAFT_83985 [Dictyostelium purpureum]|eukprot:XP_003293436.1 hypothetical protein DICPUDRAFT_83985 [Dictyostelium purpureum]